MVVLKKFWEGILEFFGIGPRISIQPSRIELKMAQAKLLQAFQVTGLLSPRESGRCGLEDYWITASDNTRYPVVLLHGARPTYSELDSVVASEELFVFELINLVTPEIIIRAAKGHQFQPSELNVRILDMKPAKKIAIR